MLFNQNITDFESDFYHLFHTNSFITSVYNLSQADVAEREGVSGWGVTKYSDAGMLQYVPQFNVQSLINKPENSI